MSSSGHAIRILARSPSPSLDETFGAVLIGTFFSLMLYGVTLHQAYRYYLMYSTDRLLLKFAVYSTVILETAHMALSCHTSYFYLVSNYTNPSALQHPIRTLQILPILTGLVIGISQAFFARRAFLFGKRYRIWVFLAMFFLVGEFGFCVVSTIVEIFLTSRGFSAFVPHTWVIATASAMAVCADFILTTVLIIALRQSRSGQPRTDSTLDVLVLYTITTGLLTSVSMLILFLFVVLRPADLIYTGISLVSTKLYANALLAALNSRKSLRDQTYDGADQATFSIQFLEGTSTQGQQSSRMAFDQSVVIELPELPKRLCGQYAMEVKDCGKCSWPEGPTEAEGQCSYLGRGAPSGRQSPFGTQDGSPPLPKREA